MTWAHYLLQVNIYLVIFYAFYKLLLAKETYFMLNRIYLIAAGIFSLTIPFIRPEWFVRQAATQQIKISVDQINMIMMRVPDNAGQFNWAKLALAIYTLGMIFFTVRFLLRLFNVQQLIRADATGMAFSFLNKKVIDPSLPGLESINRHEEVHIRQLHTLDILFFELLGIINWCNPVIYFYQKSIKNIHEYLADEAAAGIQGDKEAYAMLLLSSTFGINKNILTNTFFNQSIMKKRIFMLYKQRSTKTAILKYGLFLPLFAGTLLLSSATISGNEEINTAARELTVTDYETFETFIPTIARQDKIFDFVSTDTPPTFPGGMPKFYQYLARNVKYPAAAVKNNVQGKVFLSYIVEKDGKLTEIKVIKGVSPELDKEAVRVMQNSPKWIPGKVKGAPVRVKYSIPISFKLSK